MKRIKSIKFLMSYCLPMEVTRVSTNVRMSDLVSLTGRHMRVLKPSYLFKDTAITPLPASASMISAGFPYSSVNPASGPTYIAACDQVDWVRYFTRLRDRKVLVVTLVIWTRSKSHVTSVLVTVRCRGCVIAARL